MKSAAIGTSANDLHDSFYDRGLGMYLLSAAIARQCAVFSKLNDLGEGLRGQRCVAIHCADIDGKLPSATFVRSPRFGAVGGPGNAFCLLFAADSEDRAQDFDQLKIP